MSKYSLGLENIKSHDSLSKYDFTANPVIKKKINRRDIPKYLFIISQSINYS